MTTSDTKQRIDFLTYSHTIGLCTMQGRGYYYPSDNVIGKDSRIYVPNRAMEIDPQGVRITVCDLEGDEFFGTFTGFGRADGELVWPTAIDIDSLGQFYVSDEHTHRITVYDTSGSFVRKWGVYGSGRGELDGPSGLAFDADDNLYVADHQNNRVQRFTSEGGFLSGFGSKGAGNGQFNLPWGVTVAPNGDVYVADWHNDRIQRFSPDGDFAASYGSSGGGDGEFYRPASVVVDGEGYIYVADWGNERVQVLDREGGFVMKLRGEATLSNWAKEFLKANVEEAEARAKSNLEPDIGPFDNPYEESAHVEKYFWAPVSVKLDGEGRLYVTESNRHRIQIYKRGSEPD